MKKLKLDQQKFAGAEVLSSAQLKKVMGGDGLSAGVCDDWKNNKETCYNCCITVHTMEECADTFCPY